MNPFIVLTNYPRQSFLGGFKPYFTMAHLQKQLVLPKRKTWNKEEYAKMAKERKEREEKEALNLDLDKVENASNTDKS